MKPFVLSQIQANDLLTFEKIKSAVVAMPDLDLGIKSNGDKIVMSCHILAHAARRAFGGTEGVDVIDGEFLQGFDHSWLVTQSLNIIDVYPIGTVGGPVMIDGRSGLLSRLLYHQLDPKKKSDRRTRYKTMMKSSWFKDAVRQTTIGLCTGHGL